MATIELGVGLYSPRVAARIARIKYQNFQAWAKASLLHGRKFPIGKRGESIYTYHDLLLIRLIVRLKEQGARPKQIKTALNTIEVVSGGDPNAWLKATILFDTESRVVVAVLPENREWNPIAASKGSQKMAVIFFPELIQQLRDELVPPDQFPCVEVDPEVLGGAPVIKGTRISTRAIVSVKESGQDPQEAYPSITDDDVSNAVAYEEFLKAA